MKNRFAEILKKECEKKGISLTQLSKLSHIPRATLQDWSTGTEPKVEQLKKVSDSLEVSMHYLLFEKEDPLAKIEEQQIKLEDLFSGDIRISIQKIKRINNE